MQDDYENAGYPVLLTSAETGEGIEKVREYLKGKTSVFAGQSGVGKSSMLNALRPELELKTADISSHLGRGKHTTRHVELIEIDGGLVADTPGFSSLDFSIALMAEDLGFLFSGNGPVDKSMQIQRLPSIWGNCMCC